MKTFTIKYTSKFGFAKTVKLRAKTLEKVIYTLNEERSDVAGIIEIRDSKKARWM